MSSSVVTPYMNVARITRTHGKRGEVVVQPFDGLSFCLRPGMRVCLTPPRNLEERFLTVDRVGGGEPPLVHFAGVDGINEAQKYVGRTVLVLRADVPEVVEEQEVLDCVGCRMVDVDRGPIGTVTDVMQLPANDVWVVTGPYGEVLVPVVEEMLVEFPDEDGGDLLVRLIDGILPES